MPPRDLADRYDGAEAKQVAANTQFIGDRLEKGPPRERRLRAGPGDPGGRPGARADRAAIEAGTGVGVPEAIETPKAEIDTILKVVGGYIAASGERLLDASVNAHDIASKLAENDHLPCGSWPHAVTG